MFLVAYTPAHLIGAVNLRLEYIRAAAVARHSFPGRLNTVDFGYGRPPK